MRFVGDGDFGVVEEVDDALRGLEEDLAFFCEFETS